MKRPASEVTKESFDRAARAQPRPPRITRGVLDAVVACLRKTHPYAVTAPDGSIEQLEELEQNEDDPGFGWSAEDARSAFDDRGVLTEPLVLYRTRCCVGDVQVAFAYLGLAPHLPSGDDGDDPALTPDDHVRRSDLVTIVRAFDELRSAGIESEPCFSSTLTDALAELEGDAPHGAIFWHSQAHDAFDADGNLRAPLYLHWRGDRDVIARVLGAALSTSVVRVTVPADDGSAFTVMR